MSAGGPPFEAFLLPAPGGERYCIFHPPQGRPRGAVLYLHPFAEEMNKSRRMAALQSRAFSASGYGVLQIDLFGCGDSSGDFSAARWEIWKEDAGLAFEWLRQRVDGPIHAWGLRLGAVLALDFARSLAQTALGSLILWQPVVNGELFLTQFLRLRLAMSMMDGDAGRVSTQDLRREIVAGAVLEIAGYELAPDLALAIDRIKLAELAPHSVPVRWIEVVPDVGRALSPASQRVVDAWRSYGSRVDARTVAGVPFWSTVEIAECPDLVAETTRVVTDSVS